MSKRIKGIGVVYNPGESLYEAMRKGKKKKVKKISDKMDSGEIVRLF